MIRSTEVEAVARAICWSNGMNPDVTLGGDGVNFLWHEYESQARAAIHAYLETTGADGDPMSLASSAMELALKST